MVIVPVRIMEDFYFAGSFKDENGHDNDDDENADNDYQREVICSGKK